MTISVMFYLSLHKAKRPKQNSCRTELQEHDITYLVEFRLFLAPNMAEMFNFLWINVCNGRVRTVPTTDFDIHVLHCPYFPELLSEENGEHKVMSHTGPQAKKRPSRSIVKA